MVVYDVGVVVTSARGAGGCRLWYGVEAEQEDIGYGGEKRNLNNNNIIEISA